MRLLICAYRRGRQRDHHLYLVAAFGALPHKPLRHGPGWYHHFYQPQVNRATTAKANMTVAITLRPPGLGCTAEFPGASRLAGPRKP